MVNYKELDELCRQSIEDYDEIVGVLEDNEIEWEDLDIEEIISC